MAKSKKIAKADSKPYLAAAFYCEKIVEDKEHVFSCIRIVDTLTIELDESTPSEFPSKEHPISVQTHALISFKKGRSRRRFYNLQIEIEFPSGKTKTIHNQRIEFSKKPLGGVNLVLNTTLMVTKSGSFLLNVKLDGELITKMPLRIISTTKYRTTGKLTVEMVAAI